MRKRSIILTLAVTVIVLAACGEGGGEVAAVATVAPAPGTSAPATTAQTATTTTTTLVPLETAAPLGPPPTGYAEFRAQPTACGAAAPAAATPQEYTAPDDLSLDPTVKLVATITTSCGPIVIELDPGQAPQTVNSFVFLARDGYFDGTVSHRIIPGFVIQAGDPTATGFGGPGYVVPDELPPEGFAYSTGVVAMANSGPDSTGSQFFIMVGNSGLPPQYSAYGVVVDGFETLNAIVSIPLGQNARGETSVPLETLYIESVTVAGLD